MSEIYESIRLNGPERNVERLGVFIAWLVSNNLMDAVLVRDNGSAVARLQLQDLNGPEFFTTVMHGEFKASQLNDAGRLFAENYFVSGRFNDDYADCTYKGENEWMRFDEVSPKIRFAFRALTEPKPKLAGVAGGVAGGVAKVLQFPFRARQKKN
jgi:hypothetical protein